MNSSKGHWVEASSSGTLFHCLHLFLSSETYLSTSCTSSWAEFRFITGLVGKPRICIFVSLSSSKRNPSEGGSEYHMPSTLSKIVTYPNCHYSILDPLQHQHPLSQYQEISIITWVYANQCAEKLHTKMLHLDAIVFNETILFWK